MRCITVRQPWASAIFDAAKTVENRRWVTPYRGLLGIHCATTVDDHPDTMAFLAKANVHKSFMSQAVDKALPTGCIIGVVELYDIQPAPGDLWAMAGWHHWLLRNPVKLDRPIPCRGNTALWMPTGAAREALLAYM